MSKDCGANEMRILPSEHLPEPKEATEHSSNEVAHSRALERTTSRLVSGLVFLEQYVSRRYLGRLG
jgi:hypothetical protein